MQNNNLESKINSIINDDEKKKKLDKINNRGFKVLVFSNPDGCPYKESGTLRCTHAACPKSNIPGFEFICKIEHIDGVDLFPENCPLYGARSISVSPSAYLDPNMGYLRRCHLRLNDMIPKRSEQ